MSDTSAPLSPQQLFYLCQPPNIYSLKCPAAAPPAGQLPLNPHGPSMLHLTIGVCAVSTSIIVVATILRFYARTIILKRFNFEDGLMIFSLVGYSVFLPFFLKAIPFGLGQRTWNVTISDLFNFLHRQYVAQIIHSFSVLPSRIAIILQIMRIFDKKTRSKTNVVYWGSWVMIAFTTAYSLTVSFISIFPCKPIHRLWNQTLPGTCVNPMIPGVVGSVGNLVGDILVLSLPIIGVSDLQMRTKKKIGVSAVFATGVFACTLAAIRIYYTVQKDVLDNDYIHWATIESTIAVAESGAITLCCCFPSMPLLWKHIKQSEISSWNSSTGKTESFQMSRGAVKISHIAKRSNNTKYWDMTTDDNTTLKTESQEHITSAQLKE